MKTHMKERLNEAHDAMITVHLRLQDAMREIVQERTIPPAELTTAYDLLRESRSFLFKLAAATSK